MRERERDMKIFVVKMKRKGKMRGNERMKQEIMYLGKLEGERRRQCETTEAGKKAMTETQSVKREREERRGKEGSGR